MTFIDVTRIQLFYSTATKLQADLETKQTKALIAGDSLMSKGLYASVEKLNWYITKAQTLREQADQLNKAYEELCANMEKFMAQITQDTIDATYPGKQMVIFSSIVQDIVSKKIMIASQCESCLKDLTVLSNQYNMGVVV